MTVAELTELLETFDPGNEVRILATWESETPTGPQFRPVSLVPQVDPDTAEDLAILICTQEWDSA